MGYGLPVDQAQRWLPSWDPNKRPELESLTLYPPQRLLGDIHPKITEGQALKIANSLLGYMAYHEWNKTSSELLVFLLTDLLVNYLDDEKLAKWVRWSSDDVTKAQERLFLLHVALRVFLAALVTNRGVRPLDEIVCALRSYLHAHPEVLKDSETEYCLISAISRELQVYGVSPIIAS